jgi:hypothetical protein
MLHLQAVLCEGRGISVTIIDALRDRHLFGGLQAFADLSTWSKWETFLAASGVLL